MFNSNELQRLAGSDVYGTDGDKIGSVGNVYVDDNSDQPSWVTVRTGLFGMSESFVPLQEARFDGDHVVVPYTKDQVKDAPRVEGDGHLDRDEEERLYAHYGRDYNAGWDSDQAAGRGVAGQGTVLDDDPRRAEAERRNGTIDEPVLEMDERDERRGQTDVDPERDRPHLDAPDEARRLADDAREDDVRGDDVRGDRLRGDRVDEDATTMTRSEERLNVGTEQVETGRVRLRKYVTTEQQSVTVPVEREVLRVEREPVSGDTRSRGSISHSGDTDEEIVLREERPVVDKEVHEVERVKVGKETVTEQRDVTAEVKQEHIEVEGDETVTGRTADTDGRQPHVKGTERS